MVTVHDAYDDVRRCLDAVLARTRGAHRLLLVDDASADERILPLLRACAGSGPHVELVVHDRNRGYTASINEACRMSAGDVVLLNSDTEVSEDWLGRLAEVAYSRRDIGTVTPVSNAAGAFSVPERGAQELPDGVDVAAMARLVDRVSRKARPEAPTGNGFCLYVKRAVLDAVGLFDETAFPRGYGEENDLCIRAGAAGFAHVVDDATFVYHRRTASFGPDKARLAAAAKERLAERYPRYRSDVARFLADTDLAVLRRDLRLALKTSGRSLERPALLLVTADHETEALARALANQFECHVLRCAPAALGDRSRSDLERVCARREVRLVHVRSATPACSEALEWAAGLGIPTICSVEPRDLPAAAAGLGGCRAVVTRSEAGRRSIAERYPELAGRVRVVRPGRDAGALRPIASAPTATPWRVVVHAGGADPDGTAMVAALTALDTAATFSFHLPEIPPGDRLADAWEPLDPSCALIPPGDPGARSAALTEAWMCGLPAFAPADPELRERVSQQGGAWLLDHADPESWYRDMRAVVERPAEWAGRRAEIDAMRFRTVDDMALDHRDLYRDALAAGRRRGRGVPGLDWMRGRVRARRAS